ncbi:hypothetical protein AVEN_187213-1 [Araneus ventricosus]|uniref:Uncharacterized protein n=1 Tax=Araneus ventricosus TaxID=182803 RepID=A0A4Y1ZQD5_ARAVE|nr:hypothetical protein AVEN_187213-1 [Araneus ventricosus]
MQRMSFIVWINFKDTCTRTLVKRPIPVNTVIGCFLACHRIFSDTREQTLCATSSRMAAPRAGLSELNSGECVFFHFMTPTLRRWYLLLFFEESKSSGHDRG